MKRAVLALVLSCGGSQPGVTIASAPTASASAPEMHPRPNPLPAGACGFDGSLAGCRATPRWAVVATRARDGAEATKALAHARSAPVVEGYPFAIHSDELPAADFREGIEIVLGLFEKERDAREEGTALHADVVELATWRAYRERLPSFEDHRVVIEMLEDAPAFDEDTVRKFERGLSHDLKEDVARRTTFAREHAGVCRVHRGDVFVDVRQHALDFAYAWVPVRCGDHESFVLERSTRFMAVVSHERPPMIWQVVQVMCASVAESRPLGPAPDALGPTHMDDDCD